MSRIAVFVASTCVAAVPATAQQRETRPLEGFDAVEVGAGIDLHLRQGQRFVVEVESEDVDDIVTEVSDNTLSIRRKRTLGFFDFGDDDGSVYVTLPRLTALTATGGSDVTAEGTFSSEELDIIASGGSEVDLDVATGVLSVTASGGSDIELSGSARTARIHSSGGSDLDASELTAGEVEANSSGGSDLMVAVRDRLVANASGGSDIIYSGNPSSVSVNSSGGGDVHGR